MKEFPKFWYESNACWGWVRCVDDLKEKIPMRGLPVDDFLDKSRQCEDCKGIEFGTRREHTGEKTLREYLREHNLLDDFLALIK